MKNLLTVLILLIATSCGGGGGESTTARVVPTVGENQVETTGDYYFDPDARVLTKTYGANVDPARYAHLGLRFQTEYTFFWPDSTSQKPSQGWTDKKHFSRFSEAMIYITKTWPAFTHFSVGIKRFEFSYLIDCRTRRSFRVGSAGVEADISSTISGSLARLFVSICEDSTASNFEDLPLLVEDFIEDSKTLN